MSILDELYDYLDQPHRYERYIVCKCIFHSDSRPSLFIYEDKYRCASCGKYGNTDKLLQQLQGNPAPIRVKSSTYFNNPWTKWTKDQSIQQVIHSAHDWLVNHPSKYLEQRAIPKEYQIKAGLGYLEDWYIFPIKDLEGKLVGGVARAGQTNTDVKQAKYVLPAHQSPSLLYIPRVQLVLKSQFLFLTFGIIDSLSLAIAGFPAASTTTGKNLTASALDWCRKDIFVWPDKNEETDAMRLIAQIGWRGHLVKPNWPDGIKDINELAVHYPELLQHELSKYASNLARL